MHIRGLAFNLATVAQYVLHRLIKGCTKPQHDVIAGSCEFYICSARAYDEVSSNQGSK